LGKKLPLSRGGHCARADAKNRPGKTTLGLGRGRIRPRTDVALRNHEKRRFRSILRGTKLDAELVAKLPGNREKASRLQTSVVKIKGVEHAGAPCSPGGPEALRRKRKQGIIATTISGTSGWRARARGKTPGPQKAKGEGGKSGHERALRRPREKRSPKTKKSRSKNPPSMPRVERRGARTPSIRSPLMRKHRSPAESPMKGKEIPHPQARLTTVFPSF